MEPAFYTLEQIAEMLQVSVETVRNYTRRKKHKLKAIKIGREYRVSRENWLAWLAEMQQDEEPE